MICKVKKVKILWKTIGSEGHISFVISSSNCITFEQERELLRTLHACNCASNANFCNPESHKSVQRPISQWNKASYHKIFMNSVSDCSIIWMDWCVRRLHRLGEVTWFLHCSGTVLLDTITFVYLIWRRHNNDWTIYPSKHFLCALTLAL